MMNSVHFLWSIALGKHGKFEAAAIVPLKCSQPPAVAFLVPPLGSNADKLMQATLEIATLDHVM
jgi:hypothetical protein